MADKIQYEIDIKTGTAERSVDNLNESIADTGKATKEVESDFSELGGTLDSVTGGAISKFQGMTGAVKGAAKGFRGLRAAIISTGIGALIIAVTSLTAAFTTSEEGQNRFQKILSKIGVIAGNVSDIFTSLGKTLIAVFVDRDLKAAGEAFDEFTSRVSNFGEETQKEIKLAGELADQIAEANKRERELLVERAKVNVEINKLKTKAAEVDKFTSEQRIQFLEQAAALEDEITGKEVELAKTRFEIKQQENTLSESTREDLEEEARLEEQLIRLQEGRLIRNKELLGVAAGLRKAEADKRAAERKADIDAFQKQQDTISDILKDSITKNNDFVITSEKDVNSKLRGILDKKAEEDEKVEKLTTEQKVQLAQGALGDISTIFGEESKVGKAAAIANTTIETYKGAQAAFSSLAGIPIVGPVLGGLAAGAAVASGLANIKAIQQIGPPVQAPSVTGSRGTSISQVPDVNVVGASPINQLSQVIGEQEQKPVKAFVVADEVTTQQALDRKVTEKASIG